MTHQASPRACDNRRSTSPSRRIGMLAVLTAFLAVGLTLAGVSAPEKAEAAPVTFAQCNSLLNTPGQEVSCDVTITNTLDTTTGAHSSIIETRICTGAASSTTCVTTEPTPSPNIVNRVEQCNSSVDGGGAIVTCNVSVVNNITGEGAATPATVNQCNDSSDGSGTMTCDPSDASTTNADIHQCNNSANGGGSHTECTVTTSTTSSLLPVTINQCNYSANGGGSFVTCTAQITNNILPAAPASSVPDASTPSSTPSGGGTVPPPVGTNVIPTTIPFNPTDLTLPETGTGSLVTQSGVGFAVLLIGLAALVISRRRQPAGR